MIHPVRFTFDLFEKGISASVPSTEMKRNILLAVILMKMKF